MITSLIVSLAVVGALVVSALHEAVTRRRIVAAVAEKIAAAYYRGYDDGYTAGYATVQYETDQQVDLQALDVIAQRLQTTELPMN